MLPVDDELIRRVKTFYKNKNTKKKIQDESLVCGVICPSLVAG